MPSAPLKQCRKPGCPNVTRGESFCEKHSKKRNALVKEKSREYDKLRGTRTQRGYNNRWLRESKHFIKGKVCVICEKNGIVKMAECTDHIIPHKGDMELFWDITNWQPLCSPCNTKKAIKEEGSFGNLIKV